MPESTTDNTHQQQTQTANSTANQSNSGGFSLQAPGYNLSGGGQCPTNISSPGINSDTQSGLYAGNQTTSNSGFCINDPVFDPSTMRNTLPNAHYQGAGDEDLSQAMITLYSRPTGPELDAAIQTIARIRGLDPAEAMRQYQYAMQIKDQGQAYADQQALSHGEQPHEVSPNFNPEDIAPGGIHHGFTGSTGQLRFGMVIGDVFGIDPVFGSLISPTGGAVGPGDTSISNVNPDSPTVLHGVVHDAAGYLLNAHGVGPGYNYLGSGIEPMSTTNPLTGQLSGMLYWNDTMYADGNIHHNQNGTPIGADGRFGLGHFNLGNSNIGVAQGDGFIGATPDPDGGTRYGLGASGGLLRGNIDLAEAGQWIFGEDTVPDTVIANLEFGAGTAAVDAWINPDSGFSLGAQANLGEAALTVGTSDAQSSTDEVGRFGLSEGVGLAARGHWGDSDNDGFREFGFGADFGPISFDVKTEDPLRSLAHTVPGIGPLSDMFLPEGNLTHQAADTVGGLASDAYDAGSRAYHSASDAISNGIDYARNIGSQMWETASGKAGELWDQARNFGSDMIDNISQRASDVYRRATSFGQQLLNRGQEIASGLWDAAQSKVSSFVSRAMNFGSSIVSRVRGAASEAYERARIAGQEAVQRARQLASQAKEYAQMKMAEAKERVIQTVQGLYSTARHKMDEMKNLVRSRFAALYNGIRGLAGEAVELIPQKVRRLVSRVRNVAINGVTRIRGMASEVFDTVRQRVSRIASRAMNFATEKFSQFRGLASSAWQRISSSAQAVFNRVRSIASSIFDSVSGMASDAWDAVSSAGSSVVNGVTDFASDVGSAASNGLRSIGNGISSLFD